MKKSYLIAFTSLFFTLTLLSFPLNSIIREENAQIPSWNMKLDDSENLPKIPEDKPYPDNQIDIETKDIEDISIEDPEWFIGETQTETLFSFDSNWSSYDNDYQFFNDIEDFNYITNGFNLSYVNANIFNIITR